MSIDAAATGRGAASCKKPAANKIHLANPFFRKAQKNVKNIIGIK
jgi:hypothetical protein